MQHADVLPTGPVEVAWRDRCRDIQAAYDGDETDLEEAP
jgi:hypothetical protein